MPRCLFRASGVSSLFSETWVGPYMRALGPPTTSSCKGSTTGSSACAHAHARGCTCLASRQHEMPVGCLRKGAAAWQRHLRHGGSEARYVSSRAHPFSSSFFTIFTRQWPRATWATRKRWQQPVDGEVRLRCCFRFHGCVDDGPVLGVWRQHGRMWSTGEGCRHDMFRETRRLF